MSDYSKIENEDTLIRDNASKAVINTDADGYNAYMSRKELPQGNEKNLMI